MTLTFAKELRGRDVAVSAVAPVPTTTPLFLHGTPREAIARLASMSPLWAAREPVHIAETVARLTGPSGGSTARCSTSTAASSEPSAASNETTQQTSNESS